MPSQTPPPSRVDVVFKTHLDIGFTDTARNVVRRYLEDFIPGALRLARVTRARPERFVWTMGSWLVGRFLEEAPRAGRRAMEEAIAAGDVHWHALPFTTHTELLDAALFREALRRSARLDARFGRTTRAAKMTDVPGHTRGIVPLLAESGVRLLHIGVNPASTAPAVPPLFRWRVGDAEVVVLYEGDYGATTALPGGRALSVHLTGDNLGPHDPGSVGEVYAALRRRFPGAAVAAGGLDGVADALWAAREALPVVEREIGDSWIHGAGSDPAKTARLRALCRLRSRWIAEGRLEAGGAADFPFAENLLLVAEHTWGLDIKTHLADHAAYTRARLRRALARPAFRAVAASWEEQRGYVREAVRALPAALAREARRELALLRPRPEGKGRPWRRLAPGGAFLLGPWQAALGDDGAVRTLRLRDGGAERAARGGLGAFAYQLFGPADYRRFYRQYNALDAAWAREDFTKPGLPEVPARGWHRPRLAGLEGRGEEVRAALRFPAAAVREGAPAAARLFLRAVPGGLDLRLEWTRKGATRLPEALWLSFRPRLPAGAAWSLDKMGVPLDPRDVVPRGGRHLHAVTGPVAAGGFSLLSLDTPLVAPGRPRLLDFSPLPPGPAGAGVAFNLYNNVWGTNFPMWYADDGVFRFWLRWDDQSSGAR